MLVQVHHLTAEGVTRYFQRERSRLLPRTAAEFFCGIGLVRMGLERSGWRVLFANDIDPQKREMYEAEFEKDRGALSHEDVHLLRAEDVPTVSLATASFPCNDLSLAGARDGLKGKHSSAFWGFVRVLEQMEGRRPPLLLVENVTGFLTSHGGQDFSDALLALNRLGYWVDAFILDAARFVPQSRQRLFIVGISRDWVGLVPTPEPLVFCESEARPAALAQFMLSHQDIQWYVRQLPPLPTRTLLLEDVIEDPPPQSTEWWTEDRADYLYKQLSPRHKKLAGAMMAGNKWRYGTVFRRIRNGRSMAELRVDGIAGCLRTPRGGSGRQIVVKAGKGKFYARLLTPRECARLMGADEFTITVPLNQALFGFGDAVCVPAIGWIATNYLNPLLEEMSSCFPPASHRS